jgi:hypothetical protein
MKNEFYLIENNNDSDSPLKLNDLGDKRIYLSYGRRVSNYWDEQINKTESVNTPITSEDYDKQFANKLIQIKPPYEIINLLEFHLKFYVDIQKGSKEKFIKQMKYVIVPIIQKRKGKEVYIQLLNEWISQNDNTQNMNNNGKLNIENINAPTQIQINSPYSTLNQETTYSNQDITDFFEQLKLEIQNIENEIKEELLIEINTASKNLNKGKNINSRLLTIGALMKDIGINVFANLVATPMFIFIKPYLGL